MAGPLGVGTMSLFVNCDRTGVHADRVIMAIAASKIRSDRSFECNIIEIFIIFLLYHLRATMTEIVANRESLQYAKNTFPLQPVAKHLELREVGEIL